MSWWSTLLAERRHVPVAEFASAVVTRVGAGAAGNEGGDGPYVSHAAGAAVPSSGASADRVARLTAAIDATFRSSSRKRKPGISNTDYTLLTAWFGCKDGGGLARFERRLVSVLREGTCEPHPYYMGEAERDDTKGLIKKNGDFLVRASNNKNKLVVVYGAVEKGKVRMRNVLVSSPGEGGYGFEVKGVDVAGAGGGEDRVCETIHELTVYHQARLVRAVGHNAAVGGSEHAGKGDYRRHTAPNASRATDDQGRSTLEGSGYKPHTEHGLGISRVQSAPAAPAAEGPYGFHGGGGGGGGAGGGGGGGAAGNYGFHGGGGSGGGGGDGGGSGAYGFHSGSSGGGHGGGNSGGAYGFHGGGGGGHGGGGGGGAGGDNGAYGFHGGVAQHGAQGVLGASAVAGAGVDYRSYTGEPRVVKSASAPAAVDNSEYRSYVPDGDRGGDDVRGSSVGGGGGGGGGSPGSLRRENSAKGKQLLQVGLQTP